jgi:hypothetical protein
MMIILAGFFFAVPYHEIEEEEKTKEFANFV